MIGSLVRGVVADFAFMRGSRLLQAGSARRAQRHLGFASWLAPTNPAYLSAAARAASSAGDSDAAAAYCERALMLNHALEDVHELLTRLFIGGDSYLALLARVHEHLKPRTYLEIGVETGQSLRLVGPQARALAVDPEPALAYPLPANARLFREKSDDFFTTHDVRAELGGKPLELAFIDGMHHFEYALRDFMNIERCAARGSVVLIHDCFPHDRTTARRERVMRFWSGDVWKLVVLLKKYRPDLVIHTIAAPPTGLCMVTRLDPASRFIADNQERLVAELMALDYGYLERGRAAKLNLFPNDWERVRAVLDSRAS